MTIHFVLEINYGRAAIMPCQPAICRAPPYDLVREKWMKIMNGINPSSRRIRPGKIKHG
jgi:hypothetical protein